MTKGIDISHHNSDDPGHRPIDWRKVAGIAAPGDPVRFAMIKISEGADFRDPSDSSCRRLPAPPGPLLLPEPPKQSRPLSPNPAS